MMLLARGGHYTAGTTMPTTSIDQIITALQSLQHDVLESVSRPSAEEIARRLVDIEAQVVALEARAAQPLPAVYDHPAATDPVPPWVTAPKKRRAKKR